MYSTSGWCGLCLGFTILCTLSLHSVATGFRVSGKDSEASVDSGATRWKSLHPLCHQVMERYPLSHPLSHQVMERYPGEPPDQLCLYSLLREYETSICASPLRFGDLLVTTAQHTLSWLTLTLSSRSRPKVTSSLKLPLTPLCRWR